MVQRALPLLICLLAATSAAAQVGGGGMGGGGGGGHGGRGGGHRRQSPSNAPQSTPDPSASHKPGPTPLNQVEIVGVVKAVDAANDRLTIAYEPVEAMNWPAGAQPFPVAKHDLMAGVTIGEKVRFSLDSSRISALRPY